MVYVKQNCFQNENELLNLMKRFFLLKKKKQHSTIAFFNEYLLSPSFAFVLFNSKFL
jgi:hypothetical protein